MSTRDDLRNKMDPAYHAIDYRKLELATLARSRQALLVHRWNKYLAANPHELTTDELEQAEADGNSSEWIADPVSALAPHCCEGFREITKLLGETLRIDGTAAWDAAYHRTPPLFRAACDFGTSLENMREAAEEGRPGALVDHMNQARAAYLKIATLAKDV